MIKSILKTIKKIFIVLLVILVVIASTLAFFIWYEFYDCIGLEFYKGQEIEQIIPVDERVYLITDDAVYMAGDYNSSSRKYRNSEFHRYKEWGTPHPVKIFDGKVKNIITCELSYLLIITVDNELYRWYDLKLDKIADNIVSADAYASYGEGCVYSVIYAVDAAGSLEIIKDEGRTYSSVSNIKEIHTYRDRIFALFENGELTELILSDGSSYTKGDVIYTNVKSFDVLDTSMRYYSNKGYVVDDEEAISTPLFNVLTNDGKLYAKGAYSLYYSKQLLGFTTYVKMIYEWQLIGENVVDFSLAPQGTTMLLGESKAAYYGFDTIAAISPSHYDEYGCSYIEMDISDVESVECASSCVCVQTKDGDFYFFGGRNSFFFGRYDNAEIHYSVFEQVPFVFSPND